MGLVIYSPAALQKYGPEDRKAGKPEAEASCGPFKLVEWVKGNQLVMDRFDNALIPTVTVMGLQVGFLIGAAIVVETLFAMPGLGTFGIDAIIARDYQQVHGGFVLPHVMIP